MGKLYCRYTPRAWVSYTVGIASMAWVSYTVGIAPTETDDSLLDEDTQEHTDTIIVTNAG